MALFLRIENPSVLALIIIQIQLTIIIITITITITVAKLSGVRARQYPCIPSDFEQLTTSYTQQCSQHVHTCAYVYIHIYNAILLRASWREYVNRGLNDLLFTWRVLCVQTLTSFRPTQYSPTLGRDSPRVLALSGK